MVASESRGLPRHITECFQNLREYESNNQTSGTLGTLSAMPRSIFLLVK